MDETESLSGPGDPDGDGSTVDPEAAALARRIQSDLGYARKLYEVTGNPLYAMWAIYLVSDPRLGPARGADPAFAIPEWCLDWLHPALGNIMEIAHGVRRRGEPIASETKRKRMLTPRGATRRVPKALGLTRQGKNAFRDFGADKADIELAENQEFMRSMHTGSRPERLEDLKPWLGINREDGVVRKRIKRGRAMKRSD